VCERPCKLSSAAQPTAAGSTGCSTGGGLSASRAVRASANSRRSTEMALPAPAATAPDPRSFRDALDRFATGIAFVTAAPDGQPTGLIVNSLTPVSLEPPLVSFCPARSSLTWTRMRRTGRFGVNVLGRQHQPFAIQPTPAGADRFAGLDWEPGPSGVPLLTDALANLECEIVAEHPAGDHWIVLGRVDNLRTSPATEPAPLLRRRIRRPATASVRRRAAARTAFPLKAGVSAGPLEAPALPTQLGPALHLKHDPSPRLGDSDQARLTRPPDSSATAPKGGSNLNRRRRVSFPPAPTNSPANRRFLLIECTAALPRVRFGSGAKQTHKPTARTKKTCKRRPFAKRLKGFEPSTFCMASRRSSQLSYSRARPAL
jgi:3-hydroxy-9,10-secoandrosta-1,3,5(10)-triene-9,17-dione monooxygenase reductase component